MSFKTSLRKQLNWIASKWSKIWKNKSSTKRKISTAKKELRLQ